MTETTQPKRNGAGTRPSRTRRGLVLAGLLVLLGPQPGQAQFPPDSFTNLQVLPKDIETRELINTMRGFAIGLGVRCEFCHVGEPGQPLASFDFAADEKPTKAKARVMLRMVQHINGEHLAELEERSDPPIRVTCATCHHGVSKPQTTQALLMEAYSEGGLEAANQKYRELRERYYGTYSYDFSESVLNQVAQQLAGGGNLDDAASVLALNIEMFPNSANAQRTFVQAELLRTILGQDIEAGLARFDELAAEYGDSFNQNTLNGLGYQLLSLRRVSEAIEIFKLNVERYPQAFNTYDSLGEAYMVNGNVDLAIRNYEKSLELNPNNRNASEKLQELRTRKNR
jgi:tetratricopeptide (TPR) repeat protein